MSSIFYLQSRALSNIQRAADELTRISPKIAPYHRQSALDALKGIHSKLSDIKLANYLLLRKTHASTEAYFDDPIQGFIKEIAGNEIVDVPYDIKKMLEEMAQRPDGQALTHISAAQKYLRKAYRNLRLLQNSTLRVLMSGWVVAGFFAAALLFAIGYFVFVRSGVSAPLTQAGAGKILKSAKTNALDIKSAITSANDVLDATKMALKKLTDLISIVPALLVAIGAAYGAFRKLLIRGGS